MKKIDGQVLEFIEGNRISVLGLLQQNNRIHSATLHFAFLPDTFTFIFVTGKDSKKCESLKKGAQNASLVIGFDEAEFITFQAEGTAEITNDEKLWNKYIDKYPSRADLKDDDEVVLLKFTPSWWRLSNLKKDTEIASDK